MYIFELVTLAGIKYSEEAYEVVLPTPDGYIAVFPNHMPLVSLIVPGVISVRRKSTDPDTRLEYFATNGGVTEITGDKIKVLVDEADQEDEINEAEARKAFEHAKNLIKEAKDTMSLQHAHGLIDRQAVRIRVAELRRNKRR
jgi:F-type H+-transporting ATPase subunit epsilon